MSKPSNPTQQLSSQVDELKLKKQQKNNQLICAILMTFLAIISNLFSYFKHHKDSSPSSYKNNPPSTLAFFALVAAFVFSLTALTVALRVITKKGLPAEREDPPSIKSVNEAIKNAIVYSLTLIGMVSYLTQHWKENLFVLQIAPFILFGLLIFDFILRVVEFIVDAKGFRYLAQIIIFFLLGMLALDCIKVAETQSSETL